MWIGVSPKVRGIHGIDLGHHVARLAVPPTVTSPEMPVDQNPCRSGGLSWTAPSRSGRRRAGAPR